MADFDPYEEAFRGLSRTSAPRIQPRQTSPDFDPYSEAFEGLGNTAPKTGLWQDIKDGWKTITSPIPAIERAGKAASEFFGYGTEGKGNQDPGRPFIESAPDILGSVGPQVRGAIRGFGAGLYEEGLPGLLTPLDLATAPLPVARLRSLGKAGEAINTGMRTAELAGGAGLVAEGAGDVYEGVQTGNLGQIGQGVFRAGMGGVMGATPRPRSIAEAVAAREAAGEFADALPVEAVYPEIDPLGRAVKTPELSTPVEPTLGSELFTPDVWPLETPGRFVPTAPHVEQPVDILRERDFLSPNRDAATNAEQARLTREFLRTPEMVGRDLPTYDRLSSQEKHAIGVAGLKITDVNAMSLNEAQALVAPLVARPMVRGEAIPETPAPVREEFAGDDRRSDSVFDRRAENPTIKVAARLDRRYAGANDRRAYIEDTESPTVPAAGRESVLPEPEPPVFAKPTPEPILARPEPPQAPRIVPEQGTPQPELGTSEPVRIDEKADAQPSAVGYPAAMRSEKFSGLSVMDGPVKNMDSIASTYDEGDYDVLPGIRRVPMSDFNSSPNDNFYARDDFKRVDSLAAQIKESGQISPLIVVMEDGGPYVLEGGHRLGALHKLGADDFPAVVVDARTNRGDAATEPAIPTPTESAPIPPRADNDLRARVAQYLEENPDASREQLAEQIITMRQELDTDPLTGLGSRRRLNRTVEEAQSDPSTGYVAADLKGFKAINDTFGHTNGDRIIKAASTVFGKHFGEGAFRTMGDEFYGVIRGASDEDIAGRIKAVQADLDQLRVQVKMPDGSVVDVPRLEAHIAGGRTLDEADLAANAERRAKGSGRATDGQGVAVESGALPAASRTPEAGRQDLAGELGRTVSLEVGGETRTVRLTPDQTREWDAAEARYKEALKRYDGEGLASDPLNVKRKKALGFEYAAEKRRISGQLTGKEAAAAEASSKTLTPGRPVDVTLGDGRTSAGTVEQRPSFGRLKVKLEDGSVVTARTEDVAIRPASVTPGDDVKVRFGNNRLDATVLNVPDQPATGPTLKGKVSVRLQDGRRAFVRPEDIETPTVQEPKSEAMDLRFSPEVIETKPRKIAPIPDRKQIRVEGEPVQTSQPAAELGAATQRDAASQMTEADAKVQQQKMESAQSVQDTTRKPPESPFNFNRMNLSPENKDLLSRMYEAEPQKYREAKGGKDGKMTFQDFRDAGVRIGGIVDEKSFEAALKAGAPLSDPGAVVYAKQIADQRGRELGEAKAALDKARETGKGIEDAERDYLAASLQRANFDLAMAGAQAQAARTLVAFRVLSRERGPLEKLLTKMFAESCAFLISLGAYFAV